MDISNLLRADYLDIIFEGRNKMYGGYELRRQYAARSRRAGTIVVAAAVVLSALPTLASKMNKPVSVVPRLDTAIVVIAPPPDKADVIAPPPPPHQVMNAAPTIAAAVPRIVANEEAERPPATVDAMHDNKVGLTTEAGDGDPSLIAGPSEPGGTPGGLAVEAPKPARMIFTKVEQLAEFPGDLSAWLASHLRYPESAVRAEQQGRSIVQFVIDENGEISGVKLMRSSFAALDAEAMRVVSSMPKWKPARQNGAQVASYFNLPVDFRLD